MSQYVIRLASTGAVFSIPAGEVPVSNGDGTFEGEPIFPVVPVYAAHLATTAPLPANTRTIDQLTASSNGALTVDGVAVAVNDIVLVKDEVLQENNGRFTVLATGGVSAPFVLDRVEDPISPGINVPMVPGTLVVILRGTANGGKIAVLLTEGAIVYNTTTLNFAMLGGAGGSFVVGGTPTPGFVVTADSSGNPVWRSKTAFAATLSGVTLYEVKQTVVHPAFTSTQTATPTSALLTNNANGESLDVHLTPTSFASAQTYQKVTPNQSATWTYTVSDGISTVVVTLSATWCQYNFAGKFASGTTLAAMIAATAQYKVLNTGAVFDFSITDTGVNVVMVAVPSRYGTIVVIDRNTGLGVSITFASSASITNVQGFTESYDQYTFDAPVNGTANFHVQLA
jgi:hypothetical protein